MKVLLADKIGFCFGVKRAVSMAEAALEKGGPIYSLGSIIHNKEVTSRLSKKGLKVITDIGKIKHGSVIISSHGLSPKIAQRFLERGLKIIDTTCPFVLKAQGIAKELGDKGYKVVIVGDAEHPEVKALVDFVPKNVFVVKDAKEAKSIRLGRGEKVSVISQTTQSMGNFLDVVRTILERRPREIRVVNTICEDAEERQGRIRDLAKKVDVMLVIGGRHSANTRRLFEVCKRSLKTSHLVETEHDLKKEWFKSGGRIGIASGASTPDWIIKKVVKKIKSKRKGLCN